jgi:hypothetical protein
MRPLLCTRMGQPLRALARTVGATSPHIPQTHARSGGQVIPDQRLQPPAVGAQRNDGLNVVGIPHGRPFGHLVKSGAVGGVHRARRRNPP